MNKHRSFWKGLNRYLPKDAHQKSDGGSVRSDFKKLDSFTSETSKNHHIRNFLRNGRLRVKFMNFNLRPHIKFRHLYKFDLAASLS